MAKYFVVELENEPKFLRRIEKNNDSDGSSYWYDLFKDEEIEKNIKLVEKDIKTKENDFCSYYCKMNDIFYEIKNKLNLEELVVAEKHLGIIYNEFNELFKNYIKQSYNDILGKYKSYNDFDGLLSLFEKFANDSEVSHWGVMELDDKVRKSKKLDEISIKIDIDNLKEKIVDKIKSLLPEDLQKNINEFITGETITNSDKDGNILNFTSWISLNIKNFGWDLLIYEKDGHFTSHQDTKTKPLHYGTIMLLPPKTINKFTGGDLILDIDSEKIIIVPDETQWKLVGFTLDVLHECTRVESGKRFAFKTKLVAPESIFDIFRKNYVKQINNFNGIVDYSKYSKIINNVNKCANNHICVILKKKYYFDPLTNEDLELFVAISHKVKCASIEFDSDILRRVMHVDSVCDDEDYSIMYELLHYYDDYYMFNEDTINNHKSKIKQVGDFCGETTEYADSAGSYRDIKENFVSVIRITKA